MRWLLIAMAIGCGGSSASVNPAFAGHWIGTTTATISGLTPTAYNGFLDIAVGGDNVTVSSICPDGSGSITASGSDDTALWSGTYHCPPVAFAGCSAVSFTFQSANLHVSGNSLSASGSAVGDGCGTSRSAAFSFTGSK